MQMAHQYESNGPDNISTRIANMMTNRQKGLLFGIIGSSTYGLNPLFAMPLYQQGMEATCMLLFRYGLCTALLIAILKTMQTGLSLSRRQLCLVAICGILTSSSSLFLFLGYKVMDVGIASTLLYAYPVMVAIIMKFIYKKSQCLSVWNAVILVIIGCGMLTKTSDNACINPLGFFFIMGSALTYALYIVIVRTTELQNMAPIKQAFYSSLFGSIMLGIIILCGQPFMLPTNTVSWINLLCLAIFPTVISIVCVNYAIHQIGATQTSIMGALEPVTAILIGIYFLHENITPRILCGIAIILSAVMLIIFSEKTSQHPHTKN